MSWVCLVEESMLGDAQDPVKDTHLLEVVWVLAQPAPQLHMEAVREGLLLLVEQLSRAHRREIVAMNDNVNAPVWMPNTAW